MCFFLISPTDVLGKQQNVVRQMRIIRAVPRASIMLFSQTDL